MKKRKFLGRPFWSALPMLLLMVVIFGFSAKTAVESSKSSNVIVEVLMDERFPWAGTENDASVRETLSFLVRKCAHMSEYALLSLAALYWLSSFPLPYRRRFVAAAAISAAYAASDEFHQRFVPGRSGEVRDVLIDAAGAVLGLLMFSLLRYLVLRYRAKREKPAGGVSSGEMGMGNYGK